MCDSLLLLRLLLNLDRALSLLPPLLPLRLPLLPALLRLPLLPSKPPTLLRLPLLPLLPLEPPSLRLRPLLLALLRLPLPSLPSLPVLRLLLRCLPGQLFWCLSSLGEPKVGWPEAAPCSCCVRSDVSPAAAAATMLHTSAPKLLVAEIGLWAALPMFMSPTPHQAVRSD
jgi:hypothetical protein